jgi:hypothetical protein
MASMPADTPSTQPTERHADLPPLVSGYLKRALSASARTPAQVHITQTGEMWSKPRGRPMRFTASERFVVERAAFCWLARFRIGPAVAIRVRDCYDAGRGELGVRALGIPIRRRSGGDIALGEAYRYLAELPWVPHAIAANRELRWQQQEGRRVEVSCPLNEDRPAVVFDFDASGDIFRCSAAARPRDVDGASVPTAWGGDFSDYRSLGGIRLPTRGEVYWDLPEGRFVYWRGRVTGVQLVDERFAYGKD